MEGGEEGGVAGRREETCLRRVEKEVSSSSREFRVVLGDLKTREGDKRGKEVYAYRCTPPHHKA